MKKVMYVLTSLSHKRAFESFIERPDIQQLVIGPIPSFNSKTKIVPEDYSDFKIRDIRYFKQYKDIQNTIDSFKPNVYVQASLPVAIDLKLPVGCKKVYVSHGMVGSHVKGIIKKAGFNTSVWHGCDLYCGATDIFSEWVKHVAKVADDRILLNAIPQFDILSDPSYYQSYKQRIMSHTLKNAKKVILFAGFCCKDRYDFNQHNEDYFRTAIELERIAKKNNWLILLKPRQTYSKMVKFLGSHKWGKKYASQYAKVHNSKHVHVINTTGHIYRYFDVDAFVINGTSTIEVEACIVKKPLFMVQSMCNAIDSYGIIRKNAAIPITDLCDLEKQLSDYFHNGSGHNIVAQQAVIDDMHLTIDGNMHKRIQNKIARI